MLWKSKLTIFVSNLGPPIFSVDKNPSFYQLGSYSDHLQKHVDLQALPTVVFCCTIDDVSIVLKLTSKVWLS